MNELRLTLGWVAQAISGALVVGEPEREIADVVTDSRALGMRDLFVALRGVRFDGHAFLPDAVARGAAGVLVESGMVPAGAAGMATAGTGVIAVADTLRGLQDLAHAVRQAVGTRVVAITGSAGKTTTKEAIARFLGTQFAVVKNKGNLNNHIGVPLSLMQLRHNPEVAVMELGMNHAGEIRTLVDIAEPELRVWTNVGDAHLGFFASPDEIADAKAEILSQADADTVLVCNADDQRVMSRVRGFAGRLVTFGMAPGSTVQALEAEDRGLDGMRALVRTPVGECAVQTRLLGRGNLSNILAAIATALDFGVPLDAIVAAAGTLRPEDRRGAIRSLRNRITLVDDSYNSSPAALDVALDVLRHETGAARRVAVLGEMLELGAHATSLHERLGRTAVGAGVQRLFVVGGAPARALADAAMAAGLPVTAVTYLESSADAAEAVVGEVREGDVVLVKGSRGIRMDIVADRLTAELG